MHIQDVATTYGYTILAAKAKLEIEDLNLDTVNVSNQFRRCGLADLIANDISRHDTAIGIVDSSNCEFVLIASKERSDSSAFIYVLIASHGKA